MRTFAKPLIRAIRIASTDPEVPGAVWVLKLDEKGITFRRKGSHEARRLSWRSVIGYGLVHLRASGD